MENYIDCGKRLGKGNSTVKLVQRKSDQIVFERIMTAIKTLVPCDENDRHWNEYKRIN